MNTILRNRLADALLDRLADFHTGDRFMAVQLAEAMLSLPGIAIVDREELTDVVNGMWMVDQDGQKWVHQGHLLDVLTEAQQ